MDHQYVEEYNLADRYLMGKLLPAERAHFEEHFLDCQECLDRLEATENFRRGLQTLAVEEATHARTYAQVGFLARLARLGRAGRAALLASAILLLVAAPAAIFFAELRRVRGSLEQVKIASADLQRQYEEKRRVAERLGKEQQEAEQKLIEQRRQFESQLERERQERSRVTEELSQLTRPSAGASIFTLTAVRSAEVEQSAPVNRISISRSSPWVVFSLELAPDPEVRSWRARISGADRQPVWEGKNLQPGSRDELGIILPAGLFKAGDYLLTLEGVTQQGRYVSVSRYPFRVIPQK
jgi:hypothetical protein